MVRLDSENYTSSSEYSNRTRGITHLQIHHATTTSLGALRALMAPGGRTVSANGAMGNDGHLMGVVPESKRAFTSASSFDNNSYTIEVCNTTLSPDWGISDACHWRLAAVAVDLHRQYGMPLDRTHIIGHYEVPGTYPTACPGPSMDLNRIVRYAYQILTSTAGGDVRPIEGKEKEMKIFRVNNPDGGGLHGVIFGVGEDCLACPNESDGAFLAAQWNASGAPVSLTERELKVQTGLHGIPEHLLYDAYGTGLYWSAAKDAVALGVEIRQMLKDSHI